MCAESLLKVKQLTRHHPNGQHDLLASINCCINTGDRIILNGRAGSGKSLLLRALARLDNIDAGELFLLGQPANTINMTDYRIQVLLLQQHVELINDSVWANLSLPFQFKQHQQQTIDKPWIIKTLDFFQRDKDFLSRQAHDLSGGERQIVNLLRGLQLNPRLLLLDEPTAALDLETTLLLEDYVCHWLDENTQQRAILWISHDHDQMTRVGQQHWVMHSGKLTINPPINGV